MPAVFSRHFFALYKNISQRRPRRHKSLFPSWPGVTAAPGITRKAAGKFIGKMAFAFFLYLIYNIYDKRVYNTFAHLEEAAYLGVD